MILKPIEATMNWIDLGDIRNLYARILSHSRQALFIHHHCTRSLSHPLKWAQHFGIRQNRTDWCGLCMNGWLSGYSRVRNSTNSATSWNILRHRCNQCRESLCLFWKIFREGEDYFIFCFIKCRRWRDRRCLREKLLWACSYFEQVFCIAANRRFTIAVT